MLTLRGTCRCGKRLSEGISSRSIMLNHFDANNQAIVHFKCPACYVDIPVHITTDDQKWNYEASCHEGGSFELIKDIDLEDLFTEGDVSGYINDVVAKQPERVFLAALEDLDVVRDLAKTSRFGSETFNRMVFSQHFAIFETYLSDRLIRIVEEDRRALKAIISTFRELKDASIPFLDVFDAVEVVRNRVITGLSKLLYHNFGKVNPLYKEVFGCNIFADEKDREFMMQQVEIRHDCVHRNGKSAAGVAHVISDNHIDSLRHAILRAHHNIEVAYEEKYYVTEAY
ncbi:hypothetical protein [Neorhizobium sp. T7_12]|uniref:hypothetical protein n=1 Tax=Neorhizobium sp. T7_12 TaxID=2093832 RepID=UPI00155E7445|nr:hypothetical protein [Neorhizobium sp. T7_12]